MFVNRSKNKSGTTSVRVLQKRGRNNVLVKSFGSSHDESEIDRMVEQARDFIRHQSGTYYNLFNQPPEQSIEDFIGDLSNNQISVEGPEAVFGRLFDHVGYGEIGGLFRPLVLSRLVAPGSKLKTVDYLWRYNGVSYNVNKVYRYLDKLCGREAGSTDIKSKIEQITFAHSTQVMGGCIDVVFYDITTLYFEAADEDDLRRTGMNKTDLQIRPMYHRLKNRIEGHICICFCAYVLQLEMERLLKAANSTITLDKARELVKTMYALTYTKPGHVKSSKTMLRMDPQQQELYALVSDWVNRNLGNA